MCLEVSRGICGMGDKVWYVYKLVYCKVECDVLWRYKVFKKLEERGVSKFILDLGE